MTRQQVDGLSWFSAGSGPAVLLIHGTGVGGRAWGPQVEALGATHRCLAFDNRGFGASQPARRPHPVEAMAEDALTVLRAAGEERAHVVGHSLGGLIALLVAKRAPERVRSLSLLCTFASGRVPTKLTPWLISTGLRTVVGTRRSRRRAFLEMVLTADELAQADRDEAFVSRLADLFEHDLVGPAPIASSQVRAMGACDATPFLAGMKGIPTLVVSAEHDRLAPTSAGRALAAGVPGARYLELDRAAHAVPLTQPQRVNAALLQHFAKA